MRWALAPTRLKALFKQSTGWSPSPICPSSSGSNAPSRLLKNGSLSRLAKWPLRVGFYDQSHLNRHFKRLVGVTPKEFQRRL